MTKVLIPPFRPIYLQLLVADHILHIATINILALVCFMKKQHIQTTNKQQEVSHILLYHTDCLKYMRF